jgi:myo-inositol-1(or 4)-monophosphatase
MTAHDPAPSAATKRRAAEALAILVEAARAAGELALPDFREGQRTSSSVQYKAGGSPVTQADLDVDAFLKRELGAAFPDAGWLSEETADDAARLAHSEILVVDPIDGTRAYVAGDPRWTVALAFVVDGRPVAGVVHAPALGQTFAASLGAGSTRNGARIAASSRTRLDGAKIGGPKTLVGALAREAGVSFVLEPRIPSLAYRFARVADGSLDAALASVNAHDWDIAAADIVIAEAGAALTDTEGNALTYNRPSTRRDSLAAAPVALIDDLAEALRRAEQSLRHET